MTWLHTLILITLAAVILILSYAEYIETRWFKIKRVQVKSKKPLSAPLTILHLSDIHFAGENKSKKKFFARLRDLNPDFIFITGDIIDCDAGIEEAAKTLGSLKAKVGKLAILGNHDYWDYHMINNFEYHWRGLKTSDRPNDIKLFLKRLKDVGVQVLINANQTFTMNGKKVAIMGTDDPVTGEVDFVKTFSGVGKDSINILLTHVIDSVTSMPPMDLDFVFAGHTHGGQFRIPLIGGFMGGFKLPRKYLDGVHEMNGFTACMSRGIGASRTLILRFFCRPEAILMEITP